MNFKTIALLLVWITTSVELRSQTISLTPMSQTFQRQIFDYSDLISKSTQFKALPRILEIDPIQENITYGSALPDGAWGRGYFSEMTINVYNDVDRYNSWYNDSWSSLPLVRHNSEIIRGHLHAYMNEGGAINLDYVMQGLNYLLEIQQNQGGFLLYNKRDSPSSPDNNGAKVDPYPTSHALRTMSECYLYLKERNIPYANMVHLKEAITKSADWFLSTGLPDYYNLSPTLYNSNNKGFAIWALAEAYKVTNNSAHREVAQIITQSLIEDQTINSENGEDGLWLTGKIDYDINANGDTVNQRYHDTHIQYHMLIIRGLVEAIPIIKYDDVDTHNRLIDCLKHAINHIIRHRLYYVIGGSNSTGYNLRKYFLDTAKKPLGISYHFGESAGYEGLAMLLYHSKYHDGFTDEERRTIENLLNYISQNLDDAELRHFSGIAYYKSYLHALDNDYRILHKHWSVGTYNVNLIDNRIVTGDFDNDGYRDDIAAIYDLGFQTSSIQVWKSENSHSRFQGKLGWWTSGSGEYDANKVTGRVVSGDFDNDGYHDDIAAMYELGPGDTKIDVWLSNGDSFEYQGMNGWWSNSSYYATSLVDGRFESGDFDNDGYHDDLAVMYDYGQGNARIHVFKGYQNYFVKDNNNGWWSNSSYYATSLVDNRFKSGDFDNDGYHDDLTVMYDYGSGNTRVHIFKGLQNYFVKDNGNDGWWVSSSFYSTDFIDNRFVTGDFDKDGFHDDLGVMYDYELGNTKIHVFKGQDGAFVKDNGNNGWWVNQSYYSTDNVGDRVIVGDFNKSGSGSDIGCYYDYHNDSFRLHIWKSFKTMLSFQGLNGFWGVEDEEVIINSAGARLNSTEIGTNNVFPISESSNIKVYPNPTSGDFQILHDITEPITVKIFSLEGVELYQKETDSTPLFVSLRDMPDGLYIIKISTNSQQQFLRVLLNKSSKIH
ncbi:intergin [Fulvivirga imtechensis AK7]|uniref:Intergin n=1 Tax=Fulvivirga imtechensis AK7 TaxID=1237149 RepID=L8JKP1_9BACT|nr:T9SS type A sorting domain-containing protein [Fulvivirga imtechensis]ELR68079.1 intergin [Fulvivirga imtechensis AK7]